MFKRPMHPIEILRLILVFCVVFSLSLHAVGVVRESRSLHRIGNIAGFLTVAVASLPLVGFLVYSGIERLQLRQPGDMLLALYGLFAVGSLLLHLTARISGKNELRGPANVLFAVAVGIGILSLTILILCSGIERFKRAHRGRRKED